MDTSQPPPSRDDLDRGTSRRVEHETRASADDERAYAAADPATAPETDRDPGGSGGGAADRAARDLEHEDEPTRSE